MDGLKGGLVHVRWSNRLAVVGRGELWPLGPLADGVATTVGELVFRGYLITRLKKMNSGWSGLSPLLGLV